MPVELFWNGSTTHVTLWLLVATFLIQLVRANAYSLNHVIVSPKVCWAIFLNFAYLSLGEGHLVNSFLLVWRNYSTIWISIRLDYWGRCISNFAITFMFVYLFTMPSMCNVRYNSTTPLIQRWTMSPKTLSNLEKSKTGIVSIQRKNCFFGKTQIKRNFLTNFFQKNFKIDKIPTKWQFSYNEQYAKLKLLKQPLDPSNSKLCFMLCQTKHLLPKTMDWITEIFQQYTTPRFCLQTLLVQKNC